MQVKEITSKDQWEKFVLGFEYNTMFQSWNWGEFQQKIGKKVKRLGIFDGSELLGVAQIIINSAIRGKFLHLRHSPVMDFSNLEVARIFLDEILEFGKLEKCRFVRISPLVKKSSKAEHFLHKFGFKNCAVHDNDAETTLVLDVTKKEEELLMNFRKNTRYYIKKAERDGVKILKTSDPKYLPNFFEIYRDTVKRQVWNSYSNKYLKKEFESFVEDDQILLFLAEYKGKYIAGAMIELYGDQAIYHHSGSLTEYLKIPASYLIQWEAVKEAKKRGKKYYNFWGISPVKELDGKLEFTRRNHPWNNLSFFKLGFASEIRDFIHAKDYPLNWKYWITRVYEFLERKKRGY